MSDQDVARAFDALEDLLAASTKDPDPEAVANWHEAFKAALLAYDAAKRPEPPVGQA